MTSVLGRMPILDGSITLPALGAWHADLVCDGTKVPEGVVTFRVNGWGFTGFVVRAGVDAGRVRARIVGGAGGLSKTIEARFHTGFTAKRVAQDILARCGEKLSETSDEDILNTQLARWQIQAGLASGALTDLATATGAVWRVLRDGSIWLGREDWPDAEVEGELLDEDWSTGTLTLAPKKPSLEPGTVYAGHRIDEVAHWISATALRTEARLQGSGAVLRALLDRVRHAARFYGVYACRVLSQSAGVADCVPDDERLRGLGLVKIPLRFGLPGCTVAVPDGTRCLVGFESGDPRFPYLAGFESGSAMSTINLGTSTQFVALANKVDALFSNLKTVFDAHVHPTGVGPSGAPSVPWQPSGPASVAASKVKAE